MIEHLHIKNFLAFPELVVPELKLINLVAGKNGVGKSVLLESMFLKESADPKNAIQRIARKRAIKFLTHDVEVASKITSEPIEQDERTFSINEFSGTYFTVDPEGIVVSPQTNQQKRFQEAKNGSKVVFVQSTTKYDIISSLWDRVTLQPEEKQVKAILGSVLRVKIEGISVNSNKIKLLLGGKEKPIDIDSMGEGTRRALLLALSLVSAQNGLLLIDEVENHLHHSAIREVWKIIFKYALQFNVQVVSTTHSQDAIRQFWLEAAVKEEYRAVSQVLRLQINRNGNHEIIQFPFERLDAVMGMEMEIR